MHGQKSSRHPLQVLAVLNPGRCFGEQLLQLGPALLERTRPPVLAVELQQVEGVEERLIVMGAAMELVEDRHAGLIAADRLAVDHRRCRPQGSHGLADARVALGPVEAVAREQPHPVVALPGD